MKNEYKAELVKGHLVVKPIIERKGKDLIIKVPSFPLIHKLKKQLENDGIRNIQQI